MQSNIESDLLRRIAIGDQSALGALYDRWGQLVYSLSLSIVRVPADAEEVTQDVFLRVWNKAENFDLELGSVVSWLTVVTRRLAIDKRRSRLHRASSREVELGRDGDDGLISNSDASASVEGREIRDALGRLEMRHFEVIRLSYFDGLSHSGIADRLETPIGTVKTRLREAIGQLRIIMKVEA